MARIFYKRLINTVRKSYIKKLLLLDLSWAAVIVCVFSSFFCYGVSLIFLIPFFILIKKISRNLRVLQSGILGEKSGLELLSDLPDNFFIIPDITLVVGKKTAQIDYIIIGPTGIFIVEAKNHSGIICGNASARNLIKIKNQQKEEFYNPVYQVATHIRLLSELLSKHSEKTNIYGAVYFSNPKAVLDILTDNTAIKIFCAKENKKELLRYIKGPKNILNIKQIKQIKRIIYKNCK